jgi:2-dehydro-3-deoxyphosphogalactonate aldolase
MTAADPGVGPVAILRGLCPEQAADIGQVLYACGLRVVEVPLNSPRPFESITRLRESLPADCVVGAGTVVSVSDVDRAADAGAQLVISPNTDLEVIAETRRQGLVSMPGAATPTEAFAAHRAGCTAIKLFPASQIGLAGLAAWLEVLPPETRVIPVGGVDADSIPAWVRAGAAGVGLGSALFRPDRGADEVAVRAVAIVRAWNAATGLETSEPRLL